MALHTSNFTSHVVNNLSVVVILSSTSIEAKKVPNVALVDIVYDEFLTTGNGVAVENVSDQRTQRFGELIDVRSRSRTIS